MKPWEENWIEFEANAGFPAFAAKVSGQELRVFESLSGDDDDISRARLAAAAPDMARVLLEIEWDGEDSRCPDCGGLNPKFWPNRAQPEDGHKKDCKLDAALRKAGVGPRT